MKTLTHTVAVTLIVLAVAGLFAASTAAAQEPVSGLLISAEDIAFLEGNHSGLRTPVAESAPVGLFSATETRYLTVPFTPVPDTAPIAADEMPGLLISGTDLRFITGHGEDAPSNAWAQGADRFGIGQ